MPRKTKRVSIDLAGKEIETKGRSFEELGLPWFGVHHGIDNYEDAVDLREVQAMRCSYIYKGDHSGEDHPWDYRVGFWLKGKEEPFEMHLNAAGYVSLLNAIKQVYVPQKL